METGMISQKMAWWVIEYIFVFVFAEMCGTLHLELVPNLKGEQFDTDFWKSNLATLMYFLNI